jgi:Ran GTPase-activating protein (RanGAP) involved in mRNA processing and transport
MGSCCLSQIKEINPLKNTKVIETAPSHIPNMHPKVYALAEKVFANLADTVDRVDLRDREIGDDGGRYLSAIIPYLNKLIYLNLQFTNISLEVWDQIILSIGDLTTLRHLDLSKNTFSEDSIEILAKAIAKNVDLEALLLDSTRITSNSVTCLCSGISCAKNLKILGLADNLIEDAGVVHLSEILKSNKNLQFLDLTNNNFSYNSCGHFRSLLAHLSSLKVLKIGNNSIKDEGFIKIIRSISTSIEELSINNIQISSGGLISLCEILPSFTQLKYFVLDYNNIDQKGSKVLIDILPKLHLTHLSLVGCDVSSHRKALSLAQNCTEILI